MAVFHRMSAIIPTNSHFYVRLLDIKLFYALRVSDAKLDFFATAMS